MQDAFSIRPYRPEDQAAVVDLFVRVNRSLAPRDMQVAFAEYVTRSIEAEVGRIDQYYDAARGRGFWVATDGARLLGNFGLEPAGDDAIEVRRMYVDFAFRGRGIARAMLSHAEDWARTQGFGKIVLSTSSLQLPALALYQSAGFTLLREEIATQASHKTVGNGILRFYLEKPLKPKKQAPDGRQFRPVHGN
jgi:GNAT superfamily N-acetyltransferase